MVKEVKLVTCMPEASRSNPGRETNHHELQYRYIKYENKIYSPTQIN